MSEAATEPRRAEGAPPSRAERTSGTPASGKVVPAVASAIRILRYLSTAPEPAGVSRIARDLKLNPSTCFNILRTLAAEDFVSFDPVGKTYVISWGVMDLAHGATALRGDINTIRPLMERIAHDHGVTVTLWQPISANRKVLILSAHSRSAMRIQMAMGQRLPLLIGATGRVIAAFSKLARAELRKRFEEIRWDRPLSFEQFMAQAREAAKSGWATDEGNFATGTVSIAVPVLNDDGIAVMAATATMFTGQYDSERAAAVVADLQELAARLKYFATQ